jgi:hypothetical protein
MKLSFRHFSAALAISASLLAGCGGGGTAPAAGGAGSAGVTAMGGSFQTAAGVVTDGIDAGFYGLPTPALAPPSSFESPQQSFGGRHPTPTCSTGTLVTTSVAETTQIRYNNCVVEGSTLNGTITVAGPPTYVANETWTSTFAGFTVNTTDDSGAAVRLAYSGSQVFKDLVWTGSGQTAEATAGKVTMVDVVVDINSGAGNMSFTNLLFDFAVVSGETGMTITGGFGYTLNLADFGITVPAGAPSSVVVAFTVSTPDKLYFTETSDRGRLVLDSTLYDLELNFTTDTAIFTINGVATSYPMA